MFECVAISGGGETSGCAFNPFRTAYPYIFIAISLALACVPPAPPAPSHSHHPRPATHTTRAPRFMPFTRAAPRMPSTRRPFSNARCAASLCRHGAMRGYVLPVVVASPPVVVTPRCISLYMLALGLTQFEALYMITVFEGFMIISGAISGA